MLQPYHSQSVTNLKKALGQIERILKMIEDEEYCMAVAQQVNAAIGLLDKTNRYMLESHLLTCGTKKLAAKKSVREKFVAEIVRIFHLTK